MEQNPNRRGDSAGASGPRPYRVVEQIAASPVPQILEEGRVGEVVSTETTVTTERRALCGIAWTTKYGGSCASDSGANGATHRGAVCRGVSFVARERMDPAF